MPNLPFFATVLLTGFSFFLPHQVDAQTNGDGEYSEPEVDEPDGEVTEPSPSSGAAPASTASIIASLDAATKFCLKAGSDGYGVDCVAERLSVLSNELKGKKEFEELQAILEKASNDLHEIARANRSNTVAPAFISVQGETKTTTTRRLIAVDEAKLEIAVTQAIAVIEEAETLLLRSAEGTSDRALQYQQIASALGSNKVLLRSV
jgi:hypothetical protein